MNRVNDMRKWYQDWSKKPATVTALEEFKAIEADVRSIDITHERIAIACFNAAHYKQELDPGQIYREKIRVEKKKLKQLQNAVHILALSAGRNEKGLMWACEIAESTSGVRITRKEKPEPMALNLVVEKYFSHLEEALKDKLPELDGGPWLKKFIIGNLIYDKAISRGRKVTAETMLAFELAFYLRMHTAGRAEDSYMTGQPMPDDGDPCYPVVGGFCNAVFDLQGEWDPKQIGDNVRDLKYVGLTRWQGVNSD